MTPEATVVKQFYELLQSGDGADAARLLSPNVVLHVPGHHQLAGDYHAPTGIFEFAAASQRIATDGDRTEVIDLLAGAQFVAALCRVRAGRPGVPPLDNQTIHLARVEGQRIVEIWFHNFDQHKVDAFWGNAAVV